MNKCSKTDDYSLQQCSSDGNAYKTLSPEENRQRLHELGVRQIELELEKFESLNHMAAAVAHHFNNHLLSVIMNLDMAVNYLPRDTMPAEFLAQALESALKATEVSSMLLTYIGTTQRKRETLDLSETCLKSLSMLRDTTPKSLRFETRLPSPGPAANANSSQIQQVLINLITNAWESYEGREGRICLTVKTLLAADITPKYRFPIDYQIKGDAYACLEVADTGCGIAQKDIRSRPGIGCHQ